MEKNLELEHEKQHFQFTPTSTDCWWLGSCLIWKVVLLKSCIVTVGALWVRVHTNPRSFTCTILQIQNMSLFSFHVHGKPLHKPPIMLSNNLTKVCDLFKQTNVDCKSTPTITNRSINYQSTVKHLIIGFWHNVGSCLFIISFLWI